MRNFDELEILLYEVKGKFHKNEIHYWFPASILILMEIKCNSRPCIIIIKCFEKNNDKRMELAGIFFKDDR